MTIFVDEYSQEPSPTFRRVVPCYRCKTSKYMDEMVVKELKTARAQRGGDSIIICKKCDKKEGNNG